MKIIDAKRALNMDNSYTEIDKLKQQKVLEIVSSSFYKELVKYGIDKSDIVSVSMNLLDYATENKNGSSSNPKELYKFKINEIKDSWEKSNELSLENVSIQEINQDQIETVVEWLKANEIHATFIDFLPKEKKETYRSNTQSNHGYRGGNLYRGIPTLGWHMGMVSAITRYRAGAGR